MTSVIPSGGPVEGGVEVIISWTTPANDFISLTFGDVTFTSVSELNEYNSTNLNVTAPAQPAGTVDIVLVNSNGSAIFTYNPIQYTYYDVLPISVNPPCGTAQGGELVTVTGPSVGQNAVEVTIAEQLVLFTVVNFDQLTFITPGIVTNADVIRNIQVSYENAAPSTAGFLYLVNVLTVTPNSGLTTGGEEVTITAPSAGTGTIESITFGANEVLSFSVVDNDTITVTTPPGEAGEVLVKITYDNGCPRYGSYTYVIPCLAPTTRILMANGTYKEIQDIRRGDMVAGDKRRTESFRVSRVNTVTFTPKCKCEMVEIAPGALDADSPTQPLRLTGYHPIIFKGCRRPASCFVRMSGVKHFKNDLVLDVMGTTREGDMKVFDLQFDFDGQYVAEGVEVQSRSPFYIHTPLPRELYFDESQYRTLRVHSTVNHPLAMDASLL